MYIRAKLSDITRDDILGFARDNGIRRPDAIIREVVDSLKNFRSLAQKNGVAEQWIGRIETTINSHLTAWGELESKITSFTIEGHSFENVRIEQAYKGNFHLLAIIDGKERKFVISKNKEEYQLIANTGISNITTEQLKAWVEKYIYAIFKFK